MIKYYLIILLVFFGRHSFAQMERRIAFGLLDTSVVTVAEFNQQNGLRTKEDYLIDSAIVFFSGYNFPNVRRVAFYPQYDSLKFSEYRKIIAPGSVVIFSIFLRNKSTNKIIETQLNYLFIPPKPDY